MANSISIGQNLISSKIASTSSKLNNEIQKAALQASTGKKIITAADNPAGLAIGTGLKGNIEVLNTALGGTTQANALLGIAGGVSQVVSNTLTQMKSLAAQSIEGSVSNTQRSYLNSQFQQLVGQIDQTVTSGTFNGVTLLDGSIAGGGGVQTSTTGADSGATQSVSITFGAGAGSATATDFLEINGVKFDLAAAADITTANIALLDSASGSSLATTIAQMINNTWTSDNSTMTEFNRERLTDLVATANNGVLTITSKKAGAAGEFVVNATATNPSAYVTNLTAGSQSQTVPATTAVSQVSAVGSGFSTGSMGNSSIVAKGTMGNSTLPSLTQTQGSTGWVTLTSADLSSSKVYNMFGTQITLVNAISKSSSADQVLVGGTDFETTQNLVNYLNNSSDPNLANFTYEAQLTSAGASQIKVTTKGYSDKFNQAYFAVGSTITGTITGGAQAGIDVSHVTDNPDFVGGLASNSVTATFVGTDQAKLTIQAGDYFYQANVANTAPTTDDTIRLKSTSTDGKGGYIDLTIAANNGTSVSSQSDADTYASNIQKALAGLTFYQDRKITSFNPAGTIIEDTVAYMSNDNFTAPSVSNISVTSSQMSSTQDGAISITLSDGSVYSNNALGKSAAAGSKVTLTNSVDSNKSITLIWGADVNFEKNTNVSMLQQALTKAFGSGTGGLTFQVGTSASQSIAVTLDNISSNALFGGAIDISTANDAISASNVVQSAIDKLLGVTAIIGSYETRFQSAADSISTSIQNYESAQAVYLTADVTQASTNLDNAKAMFQAMISVLAKSNQLGESLLQLLR